MDALDRGEWPRTEAEIRVARASLFTAQAIARDLIATGREKEFEEIRSFISTIVPDLRSGTDPLNHLDDQKSYEKSSSGPQSRND